jgi:AGZA family xanthine/uracil permease-like MFS transporter
MVLMPLTHSISTGLAFGFIASVVTAVAAGRAREVHPAMWIIASMSALEIGLRG